MLPMAHSSSSRSRSPLHTQPPPQATGSHKREQLLLEATEQRLPQLLEAMAAAALLEATRRKRSPRAPHMGRRPVLRATGVQQVAACPRKQGSSSRCRSRTAVLR